MNNNNKTHKQAKVQLKGTPCEEEILFRLL